MKRLYAAVLLGCALGLSACGFLPAQAQMTTDPKDTGGATLSIIPGGTYDTVQFYAGNTPVTVGLTLSGAKVSVNAPEQCKVSPTGVSCLLNLGAGESIGIPERGVTGAEAKFNRNGGSIYYTLTVTK